MYKDYFGFKDFPFSIAPNPHYMYMSARHKEALAHLLYGVKSEGGFILLTGEVGTGKTTVCRCLLEQLPEQVDTAFILNPKLTVLELMATICDDLQIKYPKKASLKLLIDKLNEFLLQSLSEDRKTLLIIDEAQNLSVDVLEQLRLLTNLETNQRKLLQIILIGQPELLSLLARKDLRQLEQRITARFHLDALNKSEVTEYIAHRLGIASGKGDLFPPSSIAYIYRLSKGIPRLINLLCDRALLGTYAQNRAQVNRSTVSSAAREIFGTRKKRPRMLLAGLAASVLAISVTAITFNFAQTQGLFSREADLAVASSYSQLPTPDKEAFLKGENLEEMPGYADSNVALQELLRIWGTPDQLINSREPCLIAEDVGLKCMTDKGGLGKIVHLNRPVIVRLHQQYYTLTGLEGEELIVSTSGRELRIRLSEFEQIWDKEFILLWRLPPGYTSPVVPGDRGATVDWLARQMAVINEKEGRSYTGITYSNNLRNQVEKFQELNGLAPNGIVDAQTWIHINSVEGLGIPFLKIKSA